ncbi:hypothetical protein PBI_CANTARE_98 [Brevibacterium phage Cantare]|uniref:Uncharacterized protein n=1 Tax=Brevibacterium phage Cantare TaxID=2338395 RepID=A0A3G3LYX2_9CAUD|nr:hypothetical protein PQD70_gp098 [Brevibacterium phage Cantare]AYQ99318.1 hypothetical protein PBI_CANTARE_98 [Brevibacterium phage Cantare]
MQTTKSLAFAELTAYVYSNEAVLILEDVREGKSVAGATMVIDRGRREEANRMRLELGNDVFMEFIESWADHYYEELAEIKKSIPSKDEATELEWHKYDEEDTHQAFDAEGSEVIFIEALMDRDHCAKWNETYEPGRGWTVSTRDGKTINGRSANITKAKKDATKAYMDSLNAEPAPKHIIGRRGCKNCGMPAGSPFECKPVQEALPMSELKLQDIDTDKLRRMAGVMTTGTKKDEQKSLLMKIEEELANRARKDMKWIERKNISTKKIEQFLDSLMEGKKTSQELDAYDFERHDIAISAYVGMIPLNEG